jgi:hypothetical protein
VNVSVSIRRDAHLSRLSQRFQPGGYIDAVAQQITPTYYRVARVDPDAEVQSTLPRSSGAFAEAIVEIGRH